ncbi:MAG: hypothetical protein J1F32_06915 [Erysipelotrichales bacterium]|nr:hypothetical protein [Erysipelotrichales bacterium]
MNALSIILLIILILVALIIFLLTVTIKVSVLLDNNKLKVYFLNINVYSVDYAHLIAQILQNEKVKIKIKILPLINSILYVGINVKYQKEYVDHIDAYLYGLLNLFSMLNIKRINSFKYQRMIGESKVEIQAIIKVRLLNIIMSQFAS